MDRFESNRRLGDKLDKWLGKLGAAQDAGVEIRR
jgi:hypothetical protein